ncbi:TLC domain-containing protein 4-B-like [Branchiostoma floridae]|uniref:TLC domain-containing protein 4-B-like n=1 Tax=Branchiostoma floridae TaxID=7739 RepID=A0A9J7LVN7_BRAFL|nr:TLC domain-containing protein 4-B-like [Branchiostoma floridae]
MACISLGYTAADTLMMAIYAPLQDWKIVLHHSISMWGCHNIIAGPTLQYFANMVFLTELSTPFVNMRLILHTLGHRRSLQYKVNGLAMLLVFFLCRVVTIPIHFRAIPHMKTGEVYKLGTGALINISVLTPTMCVLNIFWFIKMCKGAYRVLYVPKMDTE